MGYAIQGNVSNCKILMIGQPSFNLIPNDSPWWYSSRRKKRINKNKNMRENDAGKTIRVAFQELVGGFNPCEKYESKWKSSPNRGENRQYLKPPTREVFPLNFQEKEHLEWEASFQHGPHMTLHETNSEFASENRLKPPKKEFIFQPVLFTGYISLRELFVWERVSHITFVENMTQHWGRIKPSPGLGNIGGAGSPKQNTNTHVTWVFPKIWVPPKHPFE